MFTKTDALRGLREIRGDKGDCSMPYEYAASLDMAIEMMENEPCENAVSVEALVKALEGFEKLQADAELREAIINLILAQEMVCVKQKTGEWVEKEIDGEMRPTCSICGEWGYTKWDMLTKHCPCCGVELKAPRKKGN